MTFTRKNFLSCSQQIAEAILNKKTLTRLITRESLHRSVLFAPSQILLPVKITIGI